MRLTTKGRFAVTAMIDLALRQNQPFVLPTLLGHEAVGNRLQRNFIR